MTTTEQFLDNARRHGALVSGGPVPADFVKGWGTHPFMRGMKAHHWVADRSFEFKPNPSAYEVRSACGARKFVNDRVPLLQPGNLPFCATCENKLMKAQAR